MLRSGQKRHLAIRLRHPARQLRELTKVGPESFNTFTIRQTKPRQIPWAILHLTMHLMAIAVKYRQGKLALGGHFTWYQALQIDISKCTYLIIA